MKLTERYRIRRNARRFAKMIKDLYELKTKIHIKYGYDSLEAPDGTMVFGVFIPEEDRIYVAGEIPYENLLETIGHELYHAYQYKVGQPFDEENADAFGSALAHNFINNTEG